MSGYITGEDPLPFPGLDRRGRWLSLTERAALALWEAHGDNGAYWQNESDRDAVWARTVRDVKTVLELARQALRD